MNNYYKKVKLCRELVLLNATKIKKEDIHETADEINLDYTSAERAWNNFTQTGGKFVDLRYRTGAGTIVMKPTVRAIYPMRKVKVYTAAKIILEYMHTSINSRELCNKYKISLNQFYSWLKELNISGTLMNKTVLNPKKYAKIDIKDAIWFNRNPKTKRHSITDLKPTEKLALIRVNQILNKYLEKI